MTGPRLQPLAPRGNAFDHASALQHAPTSAALGVDELRALDDLDMVPPEQADLESLDASARLLDTRSGSDELRLPPPPFRTRAGAAAYRTVGDAVSAFRRSANNPVAASGPALEAEARMIAACEGICRIQDRVTSERSRPQDDLGVALMGRSF